MGKMVGEGGDWCWWRDFLTVFVVDTRHYNINNALISKCYAFMKINVSIIDIKYY